MKMIDCAGGMVNRLILECQNFLRDFGHTYAFCGGHALELFTNTTNRPHADIDISIFSEDRRNIVEFMLSAGWNVFEHRFEWTDDKKANSYLRPIRNSNDEGLSKLLGVWAIKPDSSLIKIMPKRGEENNVDYEIQNKEQLELDFIEIIFNTHRNGKFICDEEKGIARTLDKAILHNDGVPYLAPEIMLFFICNPAYINSEYHKEKNCIDFNATAPFLPSESNEWLITALKTAYPEDCKRLAELTHFK